MIDVAPLRDAYEALRRRPDGAVVVDRTARSRGTVAGAKAREVLTGLVTNDVVALGVGAGCYAAALTAKGKILADLVILAREEDLVVSIPERAAPGWWAMIRKYVNPRLARCADVSPVTRELGVFGRGAAAVVARATGGAADVLRALPLHGHVTIPVAGVMGLVTRSPDLGGEGYVLVAPAAGSEALTTALQAAGAIGAGADLVEVARIEAGRPAWGADMDEGTLAQEANMDDLGAISYTKGCYTGQETVARVHFRGHVNRLLRGIRFEAGAPVRAGQALVDEAGQALGEVRSAADSPAFGGIGLAMVRREVAEGRAVLVPDAGGAQAEVAALPFFHA